MNPEYLAPGAYVEESRSGPQRIVGTPTAVTAFIGATPWGRARQPVMVTSFGDFTRRFGGLSRSLPLGHAVRLYFANGGRRACVVRSPAHLTLAGLQRALTALATEREIGLLQLPALTDQRLLAVALAFAERRRLFLIVDSPERATTAELTRFASVLGGNPAGQFAAVYHPWVVVADSPSQSRAMTVAPGGAVAGLIARTDETRGVWKAPAGAEAKL
ncbi:MAG TPA: phage tail sheath family protein, partial [Verrucomicrobiales bacterium]|nr:phage tail sheath family protein [Verrucomicrobiales bacterium]